MKKKACWVATERKKGWRLKLSVGNKDFPVRGLLLASRDDVEIVTYDLGTVYVHLSGTKEAP